MGFGILGFGGWVLGFQFRGLGFGVLNSGVACWVSELGGWVLGFGVREFGFGCFWFLVFGFGVGCLVVSF